MQRILEEVLARGDIGRVRPVEAHREEKRLLADTVQEADHLRGADSVRLFFVRAVLRHPAQRPAQVSCNGIDRVDLVFLPFVTAARVDGLVPRGRIVHAVLSDLRRDAVVIDFSDARHEVTVLAKHLGQRLDRGDRIAEVRAVAPYLRLVRIEAGQQRGPARVADWVVAVGAVEPDAKPLQPVEIRSLDDGMAVGSQVVVHVVGSDEEDIELVLRERTRPQQTKRENTTECHAETVPKARRAAKLATVARTLLVE